MQNALAVTGVTIVLTIAWLVIYDIFLFVEWGPAATISRQLYMTSQYNPIIPCMIGLIIGLLLGHLFWNQ